jgi:DNA-binding transcriptional LysR family regulator
MRLTLDALQVLDAVDRKGSFAAAAEELHRVPSAITYSVRQLESSLGIEVFDRSGHRAVLTAAGKELLQDGRQLLRAAADLECRVQQVAKGWEVELRIAIDTLIDVQKLYRLLEEFYAGGSGTRIRLLHEVLAGTWDALSSDRAELAIGATGDPPAGAGIVTRRLGHFELVFVAAPFHPICSEPLPLGMDVIGKYRAVSIADTSRLLAPRTVGLLAQQDVLTVPDLQAKIAAHVAGLGAGFLPRWVAEREAGAGRLRILDVASAHPAGEALVAWRGGREGRALKWFARRLEDPLVAAELLS